MCQCHKKPVGKQSFGKLHAMRMHRANFRFLLLRNTAYLETAMFSDSVSPK